MRSATWRLCDVGVSELYDTLKGVDDEVSWAKSHARLQVNCGCEIEMWIRDQRMHTVTAGRTGCKCAVAVAAMQVKFGVSVWIVVQTRTVSWSRLRLPLPALQRAAHCGGDVLNLDHLLPSIYLKRRQNGNIGRGAGL